MFWTLSKFLATQEGDVKFPGCLNIKRAKRKRKTSNNERKTKTQWNHLTFSVVLGRFRNFFGLGFELGNDPRGQVLSGPGIGTHV